MTEIYHPESAADRAAMHTMRGVHFGCASYWLPEPRERVLTERA